MEQQLWKWQFWLLNAVAAAVLVLVGVDISLALTNRTVQTEALQSQQYINQSIRLSRLNSQLIRALATTSAQSNDQQIKDLLSAHGVTFSVKPPEEGTAQQ